MSLVAVRGEVALWRAVIEQALSDATLKVLKLRPGMSPGRLTALRRIQRDQARAWLLGMGEEFHEVCALALLDTEAVRTAARRQIAQAEAIMAASVEPLRPAA
jgi:hypothetical protein